MFERILRALGTREFNYKTTRLGGRMHKGNCSIRPFPHAMGKALIAVGRIVRDGSAWAVAFG